MDSTNKIYHFEWELTNPYENLFSEKDVVTLYKGAGEGLPHIAMKLLSYLWFYHPDLTIEKTANQNWKPDLVRFDLTGQPVQWIDCGMTKRHKLDRISTKNKRTHIHIIKKSPGELASYKKMAERTLKHPDRVRYFSADPDFLNRLCEKMTGRHKLTVTITGELDHIYIDMDGEVLESEIIKM